MVRRFALVGLILVAAGCGNPMRHKTIGSWRFDLSSLKGPAIDVAKRSPDWPQHEAKLAKSTFVFLEDGTMKASILGRVVEGKWSADGRDIVLTALSPADQASLPALQINDQGTRIHLKAPDKSYEVDLVRYSLVSPWDRGSASAS